jgi:hypothetical protein
MNQRPAYIVRHEKFNEDTDLKSKGARKLIVTELYESKECLVLGEEFAPPSIDPGASPLQVLFISL